jgi:putative oxidoreductase
LRYLDSYARTGSAYAPLLLRVTLGSLFLAHLYWKFAVYPGGLDRWWYVLSAELAGALLLIPGIGVRWVSLFALPMMMGAAHFWAVRNGFWFVAAGAELPILWSVLLVLQFLLGSGPYALKTGGRLQD